jgi:hypothetical protein
VEDPVTKKERVQLIDFDEFEEKVCKFFEESIEKTFQQQISTLGDSAGLDDEQVLVSKWCDPKFGLGAGIPNNYFRISPNFVRP